MDIERRSIKDIAIEAAAVAAVWILLLVIFIASPWGPAAVHWWEEDRVGNGLKALTALAALTEVLRPVLWLWDRLIGPWLTSRDQESKAKREEMSSSIRECESLKRGIDRHVKDGVKNYRFDLTYEISGGWGRCPTQKLQDAMKVYYEKIGECSTWLEVSKRVLKLVLWETMESKLPKSKDTYLQDLFEHVLIEPTIREEQVSIPWFQTKRPDLINEISKKVDATENVNEFFKEFHDASNRELSLQMLRRKREELMSHAVKFEETIDSEQQRLEEKLKKL
jgi:hypothetical protein